MFCLTDDLSGKFENLKVGPGGDAEGSFEIIDAVGQSVESQSPPGMKIFFKALHAKKILM